jgi:heat shock protein HslJ
VLPMTPRLSLCGVIAGVVMLAACNGSGGGPSSASSAADTDSTERTTMSTVAGSTTTTTSPGVTSTAPAANDDLGIDRDLPDVDITGTWMVTEFRIYVEWHPVVFGRNAEGEPVAGANAEHEPWIEIGEVVRGNPGGCNEAYVEYFIDGNALSFTHTSTTAMACHPSDLEDLFWLLAAEEVLRVDVEGESMTWSTSGPSLRFVRGDSRQGDR